MEIRISFLGAEEQLRLIDDERRAAKSLRQEVQAYRDGASGVSVQAVADATNALAKIDALLRRIDKRHDALAETLDEFRAAKREMDKSTERAFDAIRRAGEEWE